MNRNKEIIKMSNNNLIPFEPTHPGVLLNDEIKANGLSQKELAFQLSVLPTFLNEIIKGKRPITVDIALLLEKILGITAEYWMRFQNQYEIDKAKLKEKNIYKIKLIETWKVINNYVPINNFKKLGILTGTLVNNIKIIFNIYQVQTIDSLIDLVAKFKESNLPAYYRKSKELMSDSNNILAWSKYAEYELKKQLVPEFNYENMKDLKIKLNNIFYENQDVLIKTQTLLNTIGIKFAHIQKFDKSPIDGYTFWCDNNPAIAVTIRHHRIDNFAFTIFHELGHIELHLKDKKELYFLDDFNEKDNVKDIYEKEADHYAQNSLISEQLWEDFKINYKPYDDKHILKFSKLFSINPAIIFGRLCWDTDNFKRRTEIDRKLIIQ